MCVCACMCVSHYLSKYVSVSLCVNLSTPPPSLSLSCSVQHTVLREFMHSCLSTRGKLASLPSGVIKVYKGTHFSIADELLRGFFQFYSQISLSSSVIQIRPGTVTPLSDFLLAKLSSPVLKDFKVVCCG